MLERRPLRNGFVLELMAGLGLDVGQFGTALRAETWHCLSADEQRRRVEWAMATAVHELRARSFPIWAARRLRVSEMATLGLAMRSAPSVGEAFERLARYLHIWHRATTIEVKTDDRRQVMRIEVQGVCGTGLGAQCYREFDVAAMLQEARDLAGAPVRPRAVQFVHAAPADTAEHREFFGIPVGFSMHADAIEFDLDTMAIRPATADAAVSQIVVDYLDSLAERFAPESTGLKERVLNCIKLRLSDGLPKLPDIARDVGMSERTLRRHLHERRSSYADIVVQAQSDLARRLLATTDQPVTDIALSIGFSDLSAFTRAFKRWQGETPSCYRKRLAIRL